MRHIIHNAVTSRLRSPRESHLSKQTSFINVVTNECKKRPMTGIIWLSGKSMFFFKFASSILRYGLRQVLVSKSNTCQWLLFATDRSNAIVSCPVSYGVR